MDYWLILTPTLLSWINLQILLKKESLLLVSLNYCTSSCMESNSGIMMGLKRFIKLLFTNLNYLSSVINMASWRLLIVWAVSTYELSLPFIWRWTSSLMFPLEINRWANINITKYPSIAWGDQFWVSLICCWEPMTQQIQKAVKEITTYALI